MKFYIAVEESGRKVLFTNGTEASKVDPECTQINIEANQSGIMEAYQELLDLLHEAQQASPVSGQAESQEINPEPISATTNPRDPEGSNPQPDLIVNAWFERCSMPVQLHWAQHALDQAMIQWPK